MSVNALMNDTFAFLDRPRTKLTSKFVAGQLGPSDRVAFVVHSWSRAASRTELRQLGDTVRGILASHPDYRSSDERVPPPIFVYVIGKLVNVALEGSHARALFDRLDAELPPDSKRSNTQKQSSCALPLQDASQSLGNITPAADAVIVHSPGYVSFSHDASSIFVLRTTRQLGIRESRLNACRRVCGKRTKRFARFRRNWMV